MGVSIRWSFFFVLLYVMIGIVVVVVDADTICDLPGCNCTRKAASWRTVNCSLNEHQELRLDQHHISNEVDEIFISGGQKIIFDQKAFGTMPRLTLLQIDGAQQLVMEKQSFYNLTSPSLLIKIQNCDRLIIKSVAFEDLQTPIEVEIVRCAQVSVEKSAISKLRAALFKDIGKLELAAGTFEFRNQAKQIGRHGPVSNISFDNVTIPTIPQQAFYSTVALINIRNSKIGQIDNEAFYATSILSIVITNSTIRHWRSNAVTERTLIINFKIERCTVAKFDPKAIVAGITTLIIQHSNITDIQSGAINSTVASVDIIGNMIRHFHSSGFVFRDWNRITIEQNIISVLHPHFIVPIPNNDIHKFVFAENDVYNLKPGALSFVPELDDSILIFSRNFFNQTCYCAIDEWLAELIGANATSKIRQIIDTTFCMVNDFLFSCFNLPVGAIIIQNFTELICITNTIECVPYQGEVKIVNLTNQIFLDNEPLTDTHWHPLMIIVGVLIAVSLVITSIMVLPRCSRWLKRKGYLRKSHYTQNEPTNDEENTTETMDENEQIDTSSDELTLELLQTLSKKLNDPNSYNEASEMIEQLYQKFIHNNGNIENNNQQDEEAHLYEELGNLQVPYRTDTETDILQNGPRDILKLMEEKFNTHFEHIDADEAATTTITRPALAGEYSEPSDAAVHLYSELKDNNKNAENDNKNSLRSTGSGNMAFRPLPDKPGSSKMSH